MATPHLLEALSARDQKQLSSLVTVFSKMDRTEHVKGHYYRARQAPTQQSGSQAGSRQAVTRTVMVGLRLRVRLQARGGAADHRAIRRREGGPRHRSDPLQLTALGLSPLLFW